VSVRRAKTGEALKTLDGVLRQMDPEDIVIVDATGPIALAGVMGGVATEVGSETRNVLLESASFDAVSVRKSAKRHGLRTEASARFERGLPVELAGLGLARAVQLLKEVGEASLVGASDQLNVKPERHRIVLTIERLQRVLGFGVSTEEAVAALEKLGVSVGKSSKMQIQVDEVPWWRTDLRLPEDLAEEIVRVLGYDRVPSMLPQWRPKRVSFDRDRAKIRLAREVMFGSGLFEVATYSFVSEEQLGLFGFDPAHHARLQNPMSVEQAYLRSSMLPSHLAVLARNRHYARQVGFYEISVVFAHRGGGKLPDEARKLAVTINRPELSFSYLKGILDSLNWEMNLRVEVAPAVNERLASGRSGRVLVNGNAAGWIGQLHPASVAAAKVAGEVAFMELDLEAVLAAAEPRQFAGLPKFPVIVRDLSIILKQAVTWEAVRQAAAPEVVEFVDDYQGAGVGPGERSLTLRLVVERADRTPTEEDAARAESNLLRQLERKLGAKPRD
jgi:phenylalanyl-tRNA synthetase beta chain